MAAPRFKDKVALVIGGTSGIGRTTAVQFAVEGANVMIGGRNAENGARVVEELNAAGRDGHFIQTDVCSLDQVEAIVTATVDRFGRLDCAFNNAGWEGSATATAETSEAEWQRMIDVKLTGAWRGVRAQIRAMLNQGGGAIVNMAGNWGRIGFPNYASYCAAAHGIMGLTKAAALEYAGRGIRINAVCPAAVDAPMLDRMAGGDEAVKRSFAEQFPIGRMCSQADVARAVLWLASDDAAYVNGTGLVLDGGGDA